MSPDSFTSVPTPDEISTYKDCILFGYQQMDKLLEDFFKFEKEGVTLILATALSQQPYLKGEDIGGRSYYRPKNIKSLFDTLKITSDKIFPVMTHQYSVHFKDNHSKEMAFKALKSLKYEGQSVFNFDPSLPNTLVFANQIHHEIPEDARIGVEGEPKKSFGYYDLFYKLDVKKSAYHHPDGVLWFKTDQHKVHDQKVSVLDIPTTLLNYYNIPIKSELTGKVLPVQW